MNKKYLFTFLIVWIIFVLVFSADAEQYDQERQLMVEKQIKQRGVVDPQLLDAMLKVPRHLFVPENLVSLAYNDTPLPIGYGQTISQPYIVALMTDSLKVEEGFKVLEIGTGSGYQAAVLAEIGCQVFTVEVIKILADTAQERLKSLGYPEINVRWGDGYFGWKEEAPFDSIIVTCAIDHVPPPLIEQLKEGGKMVIPVGPPYSLQTLWLFTKEKDQLTSENLGGVIFVPLLREVREE
ncbi:MAG TPA: protein-L-isoaspartate(D-aspartate) O-methyltransferase [Atribacter sp.]|jgi:protein-L-isoaspartate(D-aspartate) O-methyltransferase|uniref:Protein-L-isoaspartate O-methyltransferase n=1 Tax=Candidatus Atribacter allofermentans TaxID=1852833 RepID=A0A1V5SPP4_9BACT|nr:protein-L-isoaspartate(D-aspartate) O-methyltransferase [Atribacter sp.]MDI9595073.1 protein-L-isoaspartate(D-aspartate) O-methyltransferase [Atribacterota bacterium]OQA56520.1 MAG: Protein-L-isoaspartate O-methyltransferase [Candidatus Atribacteria bacterium ADurb.Bin276]HOT05406.1 protein-L-isoaspartate(D-aspartate) O-methyltransferase [Atribacter sp.]HQK84191.1 protein-L-isoaspartate(D-aspartate) O-methyltransferase [Atribacter sp.]